MTDCTVSGNTVGELFGNGGAVSNFEGTVTMNDCSVTGNQDGGVANIGGTLTLTDSSFRANTGVGIFTQGLDFIFGGGEGADSVTGTTTAIDCTITGNSVGSASSQLGIDGGGVSTIRSGVTTLNDCTIQNNSARNGGGVFNGGLLYLYGGTTYTFNAVTNLNDCTVSGNTATGNGGGIDNASPGSVTVDDTTIKNNSAVTGGGISNQGTLAIGSSTIENNLATSAGGGISTTAGDATITNTLILANQVASTGVALGGGIDCEGGTLSLANCTVALNQAIGGNGANGANGGNAYGGGIYVAAGAAPMSPTVSSPSIWPLAAMQATAAPTARGSEVASSTLERSPPICTPSSCSTSPPRATTT